MYTRLRDRIYKLLSRPIIHMYFLARRLNLRQVLPALEKLALRVSLPEPNEATIHTIAPNEGPLYVLGSSPTAAGNIANIYERSGEFPNIYPGALLPEGSWGTWPDERDTDPNDPVIASQQGVNGKTTPGTADDYWDRVGFLTPEPFIKDDRQDHDSLGDFMRTSQFSADNGDEDTKFYTNGSASPS